MNEELKNCPFCGKLPFFRMEYNDDEDNSKGKVYQISCHCDLYPQTAWLDTREEAIDKWNKRA